MNIPPEFGRGRLPELMRERLVDELRAKIVGELIGAERAGDREVADQLRAMARECSSLRRVRLWDRGANVETNLKLLGEELEEIRSGAGKLWLTERLFGESENRFFLGFSEADLVPLDHRGGRDDTAVLSRSLGSVVYQATLASVEPLPGTVISELPVITFHLLPLGYPTRKQEWALVVDLRHAFQVVQVGGQLRESGHLRLSDIIEEINIKAKAVGEKYPPFSVAFLAAEHPYCQYNVPRPWRLPQTYEFASSHPSIKNYNRNRILDSLRDLDKKREGLPFDYRILTMADIKKAVISGGLPKFYDISWDSLLAQEGHLNLNHMIYTVEY